MELTEIRVQLADEEKLKAFVSITIGNRLAIRNIKVIQGSEGRLFIAMPSKQGKDGKHRDIVHPVSSEYRREIESRILAEYAKMTEKHSSRSRVLDSLP